MSVLAAIPFYRETADPSTSLFSSPSVRAALDECADVAFAGMVFSLGQAVARKRGGDTVEMEDLLDGSEALIKSVEEADRSGMDPSMAAALEEIAAALATFVFDHTGAS